MYFDDAYRNGRTTKAIFQRQGGEGLEASSALAVDLKKIMNASRAKKKNQRTQAAGQTADKRNPKALTPSGPQAKKNYVLNAAKLRLEQH